jgi:hypothetical protein
MFRSPPLKTLLLKAAAGTISLGELRELVYITRSIAEAYLHHQRNTIHYICTFHGITATDLANDCISDLFEQNSEAAFPRIRHFQEKLTEEGSDLSDFEVFCAFKLFILKVVSAQLARTYAEIDPTGARIHRNLKIALKQCNNLTLIEDHRGYVVTVTNAEPLEYLAEFPLEQLERELAIHVSSSDIPTLLSALARVFIDQEEYRRSVPLIDLVQVVRNLFGRYAHDSEVTTIRLEALEESDLLRLRQEVMHAINEKIVSTYLLRKKITREEALLLSRVMHSIILEWFEKGQHLNSYYEHFRTHFGITESDYNTLWRNRVEYLSRIAREAIETYFSNNL